MENENESVEGSVKTEDISAPSEPTQTTSLAQPTEPTLPTEPTQPIQPTPPTEPQQPIELTSAPIIVPSESRETSAMAPTPPAPSSEPASTPEPTPTPVLESTPTPGSTPVPVPTPTQVLLPVSEPAPSLIKNLLLKAKEKIQWRKRKKLDKILVLASQKGSIKNQDVEKLLRVSDATATRYLSQLVREGQLKRLGKPARAKYEPL